MSKPIRLRLLRHGNVYTGGDRYEDCFFGWLEEGLRQKGYEVKADRRVANRIFRGWQNLQLISWGFTQAKGDINIVPGRLALSAWLKSLFTGAVTICVLHNFDRRDGKSRFLRLYYQVFFSLLRRLRPGRFAIVSVSPFFHTLFRRLFPGLPVFLVQNLFDVSMYRAYTQPRDKKKILLGQASSKNDNAELEKLASMLSLKGYYCYFLTMYPEDVGKFEHYEVKQVPFDVYLNEMASSYCSMAFTKINEGWPRMVHESILVGTPVIGYNNGGLGNLLRQTNSYRVKNAQEAYDLITGYEPLEIKAPETFSPAYDTASLGRWMKPPVEWVIQKLQ